MLDGKIKPNKLLEDILKDYTHKPSERQMRIRSEKEQIQDLIYGEVGLSRETIEMINSRNLTLEEAKNSVLKDRARRTNQRLTTIALKKIDAEMKATRSDRSMGRLDKLIKLRDLQKEKDNIRIPGLNGK